MKRQFMHKPFPEKGKDSLPPGQTGESARSLLPDEIPTITQPAVSQRPAYKQPASFEEPARDPRSSTGFLIRTPSFATHAVKLHGRVHKPSISDPARVPSRPLPPRPPIPQRRSRRPLPRGARILLIFLALVIIAGGVAFAYYEFNYAGTVNDITGQSAIRKNTMPQVDPLTQRTNIVLLGSDTDGKGNDPNQGQPLAQTVIIITIDPQTNYVGMLSIPRDMQVTDSDYSYVPPGGKIDEVFQAAWQGKDPATRARTAAGHIMDVIQSNYGIRVDHYAWVGLQGFIKVINELGGVDVDITHPITDDNYPDDTNNAGGSKYDYKRLYLAPGPQHLDGQTALEYVRTRHADLGGDFGRTDRQQQVLTQLKEKITQTNAIAQAPQIFKALDGYLMTDMTLDQLASLAQVADKIDINTIDRASLTPPKYAQQITDGRGNFAPICSAVEAEIQKMFTVGPTCIPQDQVSHVQPPPTSTTDTTESALASTHLSPHLPVTPVNSQAMLALSGTTKDRQVDAIGLHNLLKLMLLTVSGSFNAMQ